MLLEALTGGQAFQLFLSRFEDINYIKPAIWSSHGAMFGVYSMMHDGWFRLCSYPSLGTWAALISCQRVDLGWIYKESDIVFYQKEQLSSAFCSHRFVTLWQTSITLTKFNPFSFGYIHPVLVTKELSSSSASTILLFPYARHHRG